MGLWRSEAFVAVNPGKVAGTNAFFWPSVGKKCHPETISKAMQKQACIKPLYFQIVMILKAISPFGTVLALDQVRRWKEGWLK